MSALRVIRVVVFPQDDLRQDRYALDSAGRVWHQVWRTWEVLRPEPALPEQIVDIFRAGHDLTELGALTADGQMYACRYTAEGTVWDRLDGPEL